MMPLHVPVIASVGMDLLKTVVLPVVVVAATAVITIVVTRASDAANRRRDSYAAAVQTLVAWVEFPYRVRRRTDDTPETLSALATLGHDLQERLACHQAWIATEHPALAHTYEQARTTLARALGPVVVEAWNSPPIASAAGMNLGAWGPAGAAVEPITDVQREIEGRFGVRRLRAAFARGRGR
jgi:hypothetical protein